MKKYTYLLIITILLFSVGCSSKKSEPINLVDNISLGKKQYIEQLKNIPIDDTEDYFIITSKVKWEVPEHKKGETVSFDILIPYTVHVDGTDYSGSYILGSHQKKNDDNNPKYDVTITDLTNNYETEVLIKKK